MQIKLPPIEIPDDNPFANDVLDRQTSVESLTALLGSLNGPFVLAIDSPWGTGKTTFINMWRKHLEIHKYKCIYFNSWETDFSNDPLLAFLGEIESYVKTNFGDKDEFIERFESAKKIGTLLAKRAIPVAGKVLTAGLLDLDSFTESAIADYVKDSVDDAVDAYSAEKSLIEKFHILMTEAINNISEENNKIIIFVDEIDRCRPTYAIELLERMKHLFNIENVIFVLSLDKQQLNISLQSIYGVGINSDEYLRRFIDLEYILPKPDAEKFTECLYNRFGFEEFFKDRNDGQIRYEYKHLIDVFKSLSELFELSLRAREQCFTKISIAMMTTPNSYFFYPLLLVSLIVLKMSKPEIYKKYVFDNGSPSDVINEIDSMPGGREFLESHFGTVVECYFIAAKRNHRDVLPEVSRYTSMSKDNEISEDKRERAGKVLAILNEMDMQDKAPPLKYVVDKIELAAQFKQ